MNLHTKALYNLLRYNFLEDPSIEHEAWQVEDLRNKKSDELFLELEKLGIALDKPHFLLYGEKLNSPEEYTDFLIVDTQLEKNKDKIYLLIFELWRRFLPEKQSISIFCDELDYRLYLYDKEKLDSFELIEDGIENLLDLLNDNVDEGMDPKSILGYIGQYAAHDYESFLYDFIADMIDDGDDLYAQDLIEGFYPYISNLYWFDFLRIRLSSKSDVSIANDIIYNILPGLKKHPDVYLQLEMIHFLTEVGDPSLFLKLARLTLDQLNKKEDFIELLDSIIDYYRRLDKEDKCQKIQEILNQLKSKSNDISKNIIDKFTKDITAILI